MIIMLAVKSKSHSRSFRMFHVVRICVYFDEELHQVIVYSVTLSCKQADSYG